jgi:hypothetical protein
MSYLGANYNNYDKIDSQKNFKTQIEWQIKPGHFPFFAKEMKNPPFLINKSYDNVFYKDGKTDYLMEMEVIYSANQGLFNLLRNEKHPVFAHLRLFTGYASGVVQQFENVDATSGTD